MNWAIDHKGSAALTIVVIVVGVALGLIIHSLYHPAYAVLGGEGTLTLVDNPHNFSANSSSSAGVKAVSETQICIFCHTPHRAITDTTLLNGPLWNHTLSSQSYTVRTQGYQYYNGSASPTVINSILLTQPPTQPDGASKMCLSCHDGTVSVGSTNVGNIAMVDDSCLNSEGKIESGCSAYVGLDLRNKHVVAVPMNQYLINNALANCSAPGVTTTMKYPWTDQSGYGAEYGSNYNAVLRPTSTTYGTPGISGDSAQSSSGCSGVSQCESKYSSSYSYGVQCSSCHDPHYWVSAPNNSYPGYKFQVDGFNRLCGACHYPCL